MQRVLDFKLMRRVRDLNEIIDDVLRGAGLRPGSLWVEARDGGEFYICGANFATVLSREEATPGGIRVVAEEWVDAVTWEPPVTWEPQDEGR
jgi:hypothetical protein